MSELIREAQAGRREALDEIVRRHYPAVHGFCARRLGHDLAADAAQETFVTMQKSVGRFRGDSSFETWLLGIAHNVSRKIGARSRREFAQAADWLDPEAPSHEADVVRREALARAMAGLSEEHRTAVLMHEVEGRTYSEIGRILGVPEGTVKSRLHHAFRALRQTLTEETN